MGSTLQQFILPLALGAVALVLVLGLFNMMRGGSANTSQKLMRLRVLLQFVAIVIVMITHLGALGAEAADAWSLLRPTIYTRTGDDGTTALGTGERRPKYDLRFDAYGTIDETNAAIGIARLHLAAEPEVDAILARVQNDLFDLGADLAVPAGEGKARARCASPTRRSSASKRRSTSSMPSSQPLNSFVLPGGTPAAAHLHLARTVCRRAERPWWSWRERERATSARRDPLSQPALRSSLRRRALRQRPRRRRRDSGCRARTAEPRMVHSALRRATRSRITPRRT